MRGSGLSGRASGNHCPRETSVRPAPAPPARDYRSNRVHLPVSRLSEPKFPAPMQKGKRCNLKLNEERFHVDFPPSKTDRPLLVISCSPKSANPPQKGAKRDNRVAQQLRSALGFMSGECNTQIPLCEFDRVLSQGVPVLSSGVSEDLTETKISGRHWRRMG